MLTDDSQLTFNIQALDYEYYKNNEIQKYINYHIMI